MPNNRQKRHPKSIGVLANEATPERDEETGQDDNDESK